MEKEFVTYEQALALKELGFDEPCFVSVDSKGKNMRFHDDHTLGKNSEIIYGIYLPLYQQAFRWFREKHGLIGQPIPLSISYPGKVTHYGWSIVSNQNTNDWENEDDGFKTYEESESACLDKLIEIVKKK